MSPDEMRKMDSDGDKIDDFSEQERAEILCFEAVQSIKINENILRSETAVISTLSILNYEIN